MCSGLLSVVSFIEGCRLLLEEVQFPWEISSFMVGVDEEVYEDVKGMRSFCALWTI